MTSYALDLKSQKHYLYLGTSDGDVLLYELEQDAIRYIKTIEVKKKSPIDILLIKKGL